MVDQPTEMIGKDGKKYVIDPETKKVYPAPVEIDLNLETSSNVNYKKTDDESTRDN